MEKTEFSKLEMYGELAWAHWSSGNCRKACLRLYKIISELINNLNMQDADFCQLYIKTGSVVGWMVSILRTGSPPKTSDGQECAEPFPGIFSKPNPSLASLPMPPISVFLYNFGVFAEKCKYYDLSWDMLKKAIDQSSENPITYLIDLSLAGLSARKESYQEALDYSLSGFKAQVVGSHLRSTGTKSLDISFEEIFKSLPPEKIPNHTNWIYWYTIGPAITSWLSLRKTNISLSNILDKLEEIFKVNSEVNVSYWLSVIKDIRLSFDSETSTDDIQEQIRQKKDENNLLIFFYLSLATKTTSPLALKLKCHIYTLNFLSKHLPYTEVMLENLYLYFFKYWEQVIYTQAFSLRNPQILKNALSSIKSPNLSNISELMFLLIYAIGVKIEADIIKELSTRQQKYYS